MSRAHTPPVSFADLPVPETFPGEPLGGRPQSARRAVIAASFATLQMFHAQLGTDINGQRPPKKRN